MKKYLFIGGLVLSLSTGVYANNPFDIAKNMQEIEAEDSMLLDTLEEENVKKGDIKSDDFVVNKNVKEVETAPVVVQKVEAPKQETQEQTKKVENIFVKIDKEPVSKPQETKEPVQKAVKEEPKKEEVEQPAPKVEPKSIETQMPKAEPQKETKKQEPVKIEDDKPKVPSVADINLTKEKEDAALRAKKELEEAIKEVDMED